MAIVGDTLLAGRYRVIERLGSGGMATVFLAEDERLRRKVAVKRMHSESPEDAVLRFDREAKLGASLSHPNVVTVFDTVADDEGVLIVMEYVDGDSLAGVLAEQGNLPPERVVEIVKAIADALDHAHENGIVHRDIKPANILCGSNGDVKLVDLGIATAAERTQITSAGTVLGTPSYMAPEQLQGAALTSAVDIYALAVVAYEALSGRKARSGRTPVEIAHQVSTEPPPDLRDAIQGAPVPAAQTLQRAMSSDRSERPATAGEFARELERSFAEPTQPTRPLAAVPQPAYAATRTARSRNWLPLAGIILALLLAAGATAAILNGGGTEKSADRAAPGATPSSKADDGKAASEEPTADPAPAKKPAARDPDRGRQLQLQGYRALQSGDYERTIELERQAITMLEGSGRPEYFYAHYDIGVALRNLGRPAEAIPFLEKRLELNQNLGVVQRELDRARAEAEGSGGKGNGKGKDEDDED